MRFDAREPGTPAADWLSDPRLATLPTLGLPGRGVLVLAAHPDDETLGAGGLLAALDLRGRPATVVVATDGGAGVATPAVRDAELHDALGELAPGTDPLTLGVPDGALREAREHVASSLAELVLERADGEDPVRLVVAPWRGDGHRDHRVLGEIAADLAHEHGLPLWEYPIWLWHWAGPTTAEVPWPTMRRLVAGGEAAARRARALDAHASQVAGPDAVVPHDLRRVTGRGADTYVVTEARPHTSTGTGDSTAAGTGTATATATDVTAAFFDATYERREDPWGFTRRWYEERKRALTLAVLPERRFGRAFEVGCSIGVLTADLAERCDELLAVDVAAEAIARARTRLGERTGVRLEVADVTRDVPSGPFDLVVLSEVLYYFSPPTLAAFLARLAPALAEGAVVVGCHWRHPVEGYAASGDDVQHELVTSLTASRGAVELATYADEDVALVVLGLDGRSVAARTGLL